MKDLRSKPDRNIYTRLALEKLLKSNLTKYLKSEDVEKLNSAFISLHPGETHHTFYFEVDKSLSNLSRNLVASMSISWNVLKEKEIDAEGNLWSTYTLVISSTIKEIYSLVGDALTEWMNCLGLIDHLIKDIKSLNVPITITEMTHNNEQRITQEKEKNYLDACLSISKFLETSEGKSYRSNLRVNGSPKKILSSVIFRLINNCQEEEFKIKVNSNTSKWYPKWKYYSLKFCKDSNFFLIYKI